MSIYPSLFCYKPILFFSDMTNSFVTIHDRFFCDQNENQSRRVTHGSHRVRYTGTSESYICFEMREGTSGSHKYHVVVVYKYKSDWCHLPSQHIVLMVLYKPWYHNLTIDTLHVVCNENVTLFSQLMSTDVKELSYLGVNGSISIGCWFFSIAQC